MKVYQLTCPSCGAKVEVEERRNVFFCTYCGSKIVLDDEVKRQEYTYNYNHQTTYTDEARIKEAEAAERIQEIKLEQEKLRFSAKKKSRMADFLIPLICFGAIILLSATLALSAKFSSNREEKRLQETVEEIRTDIENGSFDSAYTKAESLYYTANWSRDIEKKWTAIRKELIDQIEEAEKTAKKAEKEQKKANDTTWWNPFH